MSEGLIFSDNPEVYASGKHTSIFVNTINQISDRLADKENPQHYLDINTREKLPQPVTRVELNSYWDSNGSESSLVIEGAIKLDLATFRHEGADNIEDFTELLQERILEAHHGSTAVNLPHEPLGFYVIDGTTTALHIRYSADLSESSIEVNTEQAAYLEDYFYEKSPRVASSNEDSMRKTAKTMVTILDTLYDSYAPHGEDRSRYYAYELSSTRHIKDPSTPTAIGRVAIMFNFKRESTQQETSSHKQSRLSGFESIGGATIAKQRLIERGDLFRDTKRMKDYGIHIEPILLYGEAHSGKTSLVKALARYTDAQLLIQDSSSTDSLTSHFKRITEASERERFILFVKDIDHLVTPQNRSVVAAPTAIQRFLRHAITHTLPNRQNLMIIASTKASAYELPADLIDDCEFEMIYIGKPSEQERRDIWINSLKLHHDKYMKRFHDRDFQSEMKAAVSYMMAFDYDRLVALTDKMNAANIQTVINHALTICANMQGDSRVRVELTQDILEQAIQSYKRH